MHPFLKNRAAAKDKAHPRCPREALPQVLQSDWKPEADDA